MKIIFFDTETTGLDWRVNGVHQLAGEIMINGDIVDGFNYRVQPFENCKMDKKSLEISNTSTEDILGYKKEPQVMLLFSLMLQKYNTDGERFFLAGWRVPEFDVHFLKALYKRNSVDDEFRKLFYSNYIDVKSLASQYLLSSRLEMSSFRLLPVAEYLGIKADKNKLHGAAYDAYLCRLIYQIVTK